MTLNELQENLKRKGYTSEEIDIWTAGHQSGGNYTANDSTFPTEITFQNGRKVGIAFDGDRPYLTIGWRGEELEGGDEMTDELKEAVDRLKRTWAAIVADGYGTNTTLTTDIQAVLAALESATERADRAEAALRVYADEKNWKSPKGSMALILWRPNQDFASTNLGFLLAKEALKEQTNDRT